MAAQAATVVLADDHAVVREGLRLLLEREAGMRVVAQVADADAAIASTRGLHPDVVVLDLSMPGRDSLQAIPELLDASPGTRVVVLTMQREPAFARAALQAGAAGYVLKDAAHAELVQAIEAARAGRTHVDPAMAAREAAAAHPERPDGLSEREVEVLRLLALGYMNPEIAAQLFLSVRTVEKHRANLQQKTRATSRAELVRYALRHGLLDASA